MKNPLTKVSISYACHILRDLRHLTASILDVYNQICICYGI